MAEASVTSEVFTKLGLASAELNLMDEATRAALLEKGITVTSQEKLLTMSWGNSLHELLKEEGEHHIIYKATDTAVEGNAAARTNTIDWTISVSNANICAVKIPYPYQIWADRVTLYAEVIEGRTPAPDAQLSFRYRKKEDSNWIDNIQAKLGENKKTITSDEIKGLTPGTTYEYQVLEGDKVSNQTCEFTTEAALQLPNSGFENWSGATPMLIHGSGEEMFWDSGNHGSSSFSLAAVDLTTKASDFKVEGNYSAKLESKKVVVKFAAGNLFVGSYLKTDGTDGILGWGRPWKSRPLALRGYVRYMPKACENEKFPDGMDRGIIYVAIGDWTGAEYDKNWPIVIQTKKPDTELFNPEKGSYTGDGIIAYGEKILQGEVKGADGGMIEFTIPLDYRSYERMPKSIIVVASASQYGDYFIGGIGSTMWLDDLELIYEESKLSKQ